MKITAIAREDLSNIYGGLVPNEIKLELSGQIVPDSYGKRIGYYDVEKNPTCHISRKTKKKVIQIVLMPTKIVVASKKKGMKYIRNVISKR